MIKQNIKLRRRSSVPPISMFRSSKNCVSKKRDSFFKFNQQKFQDQQNPADSLNKIKKKAILRTSINNFQKQKTQFNIIENPKKSAYSHSKLLVYQKLILGVTIMGFLLNFCRVQASFQQISSQTLIHFYIVNYMNTACLVFLLILRYVALFALKVDQKKLYISQIVIKQNKQVKFSASFKQFIFKSECQKLLVIQLILILIFQPYHFLEDVSISILDTFNQVYQDHSLNSLFTAAMIIRIYLILRCIINFTIYTTPRCQRLCLTSGFQYSTNYVIKCLLQQFPLRSIFCAFTLAVILLAFGLRLSQGLINKGTPLYGTTHLSNFYNCIWCIFITMTTVGYGDLSPQTIPGMLVIIFAAILGVIMSSLLIVGLSSYLKMRPNQFKALVTLHRLIEYKNLTKKSKQALVQICRLDQIFRQKKNQTKEEKERKLKQYFQNLRKIIQQSKQSNKKLKSFVNNFSVFQQMNRLFEIFRDSLKQLYANQESIKKYLQKIELKLRVKINLEKRSSVMKRSLRQTMKNTLRNSLKKQTDIFLQSLKSDQVARSRERKKLFHKTSIEAQTFFKKFE